jgi:uncharacterized lipoprotein YddW (UPF0748 family)
MGKMGRPQRAQRWLRSLICFGTALLLAIAGPGLPPLGAWASAPKQLTPAIDPPVSPPLIPIDIQTHWARECLTTLAQQRRITADASGRFYPDDPILWGDYVALLNQISPPGATQRWAHPLEQALGVTTAPSLASHYPSQYFQRDRPLVRAEGIMALATKLGGSYQLTANTLINASLEDGRQVPEYAREGVAAALALGVVVNYPQANRMQPTQRLTRGEAAALLCRAAPDPALRRTLDPAWIAQAQTTPVATPLRETRGVWLTNVDSQVLFSTAALQTAVDRLADLNFNTLYPVVWNFGHTLYPSATAKRELGVSQHLYGDLRAPGPASESDRDMLKEAVEFGHARGMAVVPWFEFGFMAPAHYELHRRHPDWFTQRRVEPTPVAPSSSKPSDRPLLAALDQTKAGDLAREQQRADQWLAQRDLAQLDRSKVDLAQVDEFLPDDVPLNDPGIWMEGNVIPRRWMNPFHPQVQRFQLQLIDDLMSNYEVDGFQFDDHLGLPVDFGYDPYTINLYRAEHNGQAPPTNPQDAEWVAWRANKISDFLAEVYKLVKARRPNAVVSISPNPYPFAYVNYLQDWPAWVSRGLVDELIVQIYRSDQNRFMWEMNKPSIHAARRRIPVSVGILSGLRAAPVAMDFITDQMAAVRDRAYAGMAFFFYESLWVSPPPETAAQRVEKLQRAFASRANRPG